MQAMNFMSYYEMSSLTIEYENIFLLKSAK
jgi:hypothetical protein